MSWKIRNERLYPERLEVNVAHHCNLSCEQCNHLSPYLPRYFISPDNLYRDLLLLSKYCRPELISLLGGEPLLHPNFLEIVNIVRKSGISKRIRVVTNGLLLHRMSEQFWQGVDEVCVSLYPSHPMKVKDLSKFQESAKRNKSSLHLRYQDYFYESFAESSHANNELVNRIYSTCKIPNEVSCHTLFEGYYYKCPQAVFIPFMKKDRFDMNNFCDGVKIRDSNSFLEELRGYLSMVQPLEACRYCLGSVGKRFIPEQIPRRSVPKSISSEELIDWTYLEKLEHATSPTISGFMWKIWQMISNLIAKLPPSVRLSPRLRWVIKSLRDIARRFMK